jgi:hypothetical protein
MDCKSGAAINWSCVFVLTKWLQIHLQKQWTNWLDCPKIQQKHYKYQHVAQCSWGRLPALSLGAHTRNPIFHRKLVCNIYWHEDWLGKYCYSAAFDWPRKWTLKRPYLYIKSFRSSIFACTRRVCSKLNDMLWQKGKGWIMEFLIMLHKLQCFLILSDMQMLCFLCRYHNFDAW